MEAFDNRIRETGINAQSYNFWLKMYVRDTPHELDASDVHDDFKSLKVSPLMEKIHFLAWDPLSDSESSTNAIVYYNDPNLVWKIST